LLGEGDDRFGNFLTIAHCCSPVPCRAKTRRPKRTGWNKASYGALWSEFWDAVDSGRADSCNWAWRFGDRNEYRIFGLDVDGNGGDDWALRALPITQTVRTPSGGFHLYYVLGPKLPKHRLIRMGRRGTIEVKARRCDLVLRPGSETDEGRYEYVRGREPTRVPLHILSEKEVAFLDGLDRPRKRARRKRGEGELDVLLRQGTEKGDRDRACCRLIGYLRARGLDDEAVVSELLEWNPRCDPPWGSRSDDYPRDPEAWIWEKLGRLKRPALRRLSKREESKAEFRGWLSEACLLGETEAVEQGPCISSLVSWGKARGHVWTRRLASDMIRNLPGIRQGSRGSFRLGTKKRCYFGIGLKPQEWGVMRVAQRLSERLGTRSSAYGE